jgi:BMFP domain-containing protein YqiC
MKTPFDAFDEVAKRLADVVTASPAADLQKNMRATLTGVFSRLDLVTREEFDLQAQLLERARARLAQLEARLADMESRKP